MWHTGDVFVEESASSWVLVQPLLIPLVVDMEEVESNPWSAGVTVQATLIDEAGMSVASAETTCTEWITWWSRAR